MASLTQITWEDETGQTYSMAFDATISQKHTSPNTITDHAVESGTNVADHIRQEPDHLSIKGVISNTPLTLPADHVDGARAVTVEVEGVAPSVRVPLPLVGSLVGNISIAPTPKGHVTGFSPAFDRVAACYEALLKIRNEGILVRAITSLREYDDMGIELLEVTKEPTTGNILDFSLELKQVRFGSTEEVPVPVIPRNKKDKGPKASIAEEPPGAERASVLHNLFGST